MVQKSSSKKSRFFIVRVIGIAGPECYAGMVYYGHEAEAESFLASDDFVLAPFLKFSTLREIMKRAMACDCELLILQDCNNNLFKYAVTEIIGDRGLLCIKN